MKKIYSFVLPGILACFLHFTIQAQTKGWEEATRKEKLQRIQNSGKSLKELAQRQNAEMILSNNKLKNTTKNQSLYCNSGSALCDEYISQVTLTGASTVINNSSNCSPGGYEDNSSIIGTVYQGDFLVLEIGNGNAIPGSVCGVWVDWNQNGIFDDDTIIPLNGPDVFQAVFQVPVWASGSYKMRIKITASAVPDPCSIDSTGETEDYTLDVYPSPIFYDIGDTALLNPVSVNDLPSTFYPTVEITNFGTIPVTSFPISFKVNGTLVVADTFTGWLDTGISMQYTFSQGYYLPICNVYHFLFYTSLPNDENIPNDDLLINLDATFHLNVTPGGNLQQIVNSILPGNGITISNITYTGHANARGKFKSPCPSFGLDSGMVIASGYVTTAIGPNTTTSAGTSLNLPGDAQLSALVGENTYDASVLQFDLVPQYDSIQFRYIFGSEEYPEFVNYYNDVFAFFLSGPIPGGGNYVNKNIAIVPGTVNTPVSINNINNGHYNTGPCVHCNNYVHNLWNVTQLDAYTTPLTAFFTAVPGASYHLKIAIADTRDHSYDSDVFLEAGSFTSPSGNTSVSGVVQYDNTSNSPLQNTTVFLKQNNQIIAQSTTNEFGHYQFNNVPAGTYSLITTTTLPWGGGNSTDALLILKHFVGMNFLHNMPLLAADPSGDHFINSLDALLVVRRFVAFITSFPNGIDWIFETPVITFNGLNPVVQDIRGICVGDVNQSYIP